MNRQEYLAHQFATLRREIEGQQMRIFWIIMVGLLGLPLLGYFLLTATTQIWLTLPFFSLVLIILYLAEQNHMIRAGRYIREYIEPNVDFKPAWENWLSGHPELRLIDQHFSSCFVLLFFLYYFVSLVLVMHRLVTAAIFGESQQDWWWVGCVGTIYFVVTIWGGSTLIHHWRSLISVRREP